MFVEDFGRRRLVIRVRRHSWRVHTSSARCSTFLSDHPTFPTDFSFSLNTPARAGKTRYNLIPNPVVAFFFVCLFFFASHHRSLATKIETKRYRERERERERKVKLGKGLEVIIWSGRCSDVDGRSFGMETMESSAIGNSAAAAAAEAADGAPESLICTLKIDNVNQRVG